MLRGAKTITEIIGLVMQTFISAGWENKLAQANSKLQSLILFNFSEK